MSEWISVEDRLPEFDKKVLVMFKTTIGTLEYKVAKYIDYKYCAHHDKTVQKWLGIACTMREVYSVTHWQSLPEPPKESK